MKQRNNINTSTEILIHGYTLVILAVTGFLLLMGKGSALEVLLYAAPCFTESVRFLTEERRVVRNKIVVIVNVVALIATIAVLVLGIISVAGYTGMDTVLSILMMVYPFKEAVLFAFYLVLALSR